jgi:hypothetical protein
VSRIAVQYPVVDKKDHTTGAIHRLSINSMMLVKVDFEFVNLVYGQDF